VEAAVENGEHFRREFLLEPFERVAEGQQPLCGFPLFRVEASQVRPQPPCFRGGVGDRLEQAHGSGAEPGQAGADGDEHRRQGNR
jgi:hypothetical protein